jgi:Na+-translocating ferredoxin:NAD+ oxidoreductase subunit E
MILNELKRNALSENPLLVLGLGLCPAAAVSSSLIDGFAISCATTLVLIAANIFCSLFRGLLTGRVQLVGSIIITAVFTSIVQIGFNEWMPELSSRLGVYVGLIAVNCIVLSRIKVIATRSGIRRSLGDGILVGFGFSLALCAISAFREIIGSNTLLGYRAIPGYEPMTLFQLAPGGFFAIAFGLGLANYLRLHKGGKQA